MQKPVSIEVKNLSVRYEVSKYGFTSFKEWVLQRRKVQNSTKIVNALNNVSLEVRKGESLALIGHNGCGKSTLLKVIAGIIIAPGATIKLLGRVAPLIELGAGFDRELSGLENIRLSCTLMGLTKSEIDDRMESIIAFSELRDFIEIPLKNYSSGMYARLGFACATAVDPDVLLVDEVLAVGDSNFGRKCLGRIHDLQSRGTTIVLVSHDASAVRTFCNRAIVLSEGNLVFQGDVDSAIAKHEEVMAAREFATLSDEEQRELLRVRALRAAEGDLDLTRGEKPQVESNFQVVQDERTPESIDVTRPFRIEFFHKIKHSERFNGEVSVGIGLETAEKVRVGGCNNLMRMVHFPALPDSVGRVLTTFEFENGIKDLCAGTYRLILGIHDGRISRDIRTEVIGVLNFHNSQLGINHDRDILNLGSHLSAIAFRPY
jgi:ABC-type polysaccharide/polyol phosphate transport system ATPase subunit